jgi:hypothetical protein
MNSHDASTQAAGFEQQIALLDYFQGSVAAISFPSNAQADAKRVLSTTAAEVSDLRNLEANIGNIPEYNQILTQLTSAQASVASANAALFSDLGLVVQTPTTSG